MTKSSQTHCPHRHELILLLSCYSSCWGCACQATVCATCHEALILSSARLVIRGCAACQAVNQLWREPECSLQHWVVCVCSARGADQQVPLRWQAGRRLVVRRDAVHYALLRVPLRAPCRRSDLGPRRQALANAQRILAADYQLPASPAVSSGCKDLLSRILTVSPVERINVTEIQQHPWFCEVIGNAFTTPSRNAGKEAALD